MLARLVASVLICLFLVVINIGIMIYGWGLTPVSWPIIIGGTMFQLFLASISTLLNEENKKY